MVRSDISLGQFHEIIQIAIGWNDCHLHQFIIDGQMYGPKNDSDFGSSMLDEMEGEDEANYALADFRFREKEKFQYEYDFGDGWEHDVAVEKVLAVDPKQDYPICIGGKRRCPPEDCGGPCGYGEFLDAVQDSSHPEHEEMIDWFGREFNPEDFDVDTVNGQLH